MKKPELKDLYIFSKQMQVMLKAHIPLNRAIRLIADSTINSALKSSLYRILIYLEAGHSLTNSFQKCSNIFSSIFVTMTEIGEKTGKMSDAFLHITHYYEFEMNAIKRLKQVSRYPSFLLIVIFFAIGIINIVIVPKFKLFFLQFDAELPWATQILINTSNFLVNNWFLLLFMIVTLMLAFQYWRRQPVGCLQWGRFVLRVPFLGSIIERNNLSRFCRSMGLAITSGIPLNEALTLVGRAADNAYVSQHIQLIREFLERGETLSQSMAKSHLFSNLVLQMITVGEETADLAGSLFQVADFYEAELEYDIKKLSDTLEPILIGIVSIFVLILALGVFLPMWDISNVAFNKMHAE